VTAVVLGRDGVTPIYLGGHIVPPPPGMRPEEIAREAERLLPASTNVQVSVPFNSLLANSILVAYAAVLVQVLFFYTRAVARREAEQLARAAAERDRAAERAAEIDAELESVRRRLLEVEPAERSHAEEIRALQTERAALLEKLSALAERESDLRRGAARASDLEQERQALEELLEEASADLAAKNEELSDLQGRLSRVDKLAAKGGGRGRESEWLERRLRTLYKNLEIDDRAIDDIAGLGDESLKLRAEEALKRLSDEAENVAVRRKVGGLPPQLSIFELGFAGKGRIYYAKGRQRRFRVLLVGAKNSQKPDLEYLSRLPRESA
jgi:DNA repair exonuclease SbcCD ATPase subunit